MNVEIKKDGQMILTKEYGSYVNFLFNLSFIRWDKYGPFIKKPMFVVFYNTKWDSWGHIESHGDLWARKFIISHFRTKNVIFELKRYFQRPFFGKNRKFWP